jgi:hypothetical protein
MSNSSIRGASLGRRVDVLSDTIGEIKSDLLLCGTAETHRPPACFPGCPVLANYKRWCIMARIGYSILADIVVGVHFLFVLFVILGGLVAVKWRRIMSLHIAAAVWGALIEFAGWVCPLTPLENWFRDKAGQESYRSDFVARYLLPVLYPEGLTRSVQIALGVIVVALNLVIYTWFWRSLRRGNQD